MSWLSGWFSKQEVPAYQVEENTRNDYVKWAEGDGKVKVAVNCPLNEVCVLEEGCSRKDCAESGICAVQTDLDHERFLHSITQGELQKEVDNRLRLQKELDSVQQELKSEIEAHNVTGDHLDNSENELEFLKEKNQQLESALSEKELIIAEKVLELKKFYEEMAELQKEVLLGNKNKSFDERVEYARQNYVPQASPVKVSKNSVSTK